MRNLFSSVLLLGGLLLGGTACTGDVVVDADDGAGGGDASTGSAPDDDGSSDDGTDDDGAGGADVVASSTTVGPATSTTVGGGAGGEGAGGAAEGGGEASGGAPPVSEVCALTGEIAITEVAIDVDAWRAGETATLFVTIASPVDNFQYPGVRITPDVASVTPSDVEHTLFGVAAGEAVQLQASFVADPSTAPGTVVTFDIEVFALNHACPNTARVTVEVPVL